MEFDIRLSLEAISNPPFIPRLRVGLVCLTNPTRKRGMVLKQLVRKHGNARFLCDLCAPTFVRTSSAWLLLSLQVAGIELLLISADKRRLAVSPLFDCLGDLL